MPRITIRDILSAALGAIALFGLLYVGLWITP